ncbi:Autophagy-related 27 protein [Rutstroemia sp. NJR-2017a WRK4]|nr:Autophagy-related 27 protein [Rutstroemia sp. NJR-2017a WRK4]
MRLAHIPTGAAILATIIFPLLGAASGNFDCKNIVIDGRTFNLGPLDGPRSVLHSVEDFIGDEGRGWTNTTYTIDICKAIVKKGFHECPGGTRVCGITHVINEAEGSDATQQIIPFAGSLENSGGGSLDAKYERLSASKAHSDAGKEGLRFELNGGFRGNGKGKKPQKAIVEFICDRNRTGLENLWVPPEPKGKEKLNERDEPIPGGAANDSSLQFFTLDEHDDVDILRLTWRTKEACEEGSTDDGNDQSSTHWGFFTWFIIVYVYMLNFSNIGLTICNSAFLSTAAYLIFGSWLNYNRYGARGWDLLPHGDTIRDVPYLLKDWTRRVLNTVQGGGSRGGYAAV